MSSQSYDERRGPISTLAGQLAQWMVVGSEAAFDAKNLQGLSIFRGLVRRND